MKRTMTLIAATLALVLGACDGGAGRGINQRVELMRFDSCDELESYIKSTAVRKMNQRLDQNLRSSLVRSGGMFADENGVALPESSQGSPTGDGQDPAGWTETNRQHQDVDEPDFFKNDGKRIFVLSGSTLFAARSWPPADLAVVGKLSLSGKPAEMFLDGTRLAVFTTEYDSSDAWGGRNQSTRITMVDVSDISSPRKTAEFTFPGAYKSARRVGSVVRLVLSDSLRWPTGLRYSVSSSARVSKPMMMALYAQRRSENEKLIRGHGLKQWLPEAQFAAQGDQGTKLTYRCSDFYRPDAEVDLGLASVISFDMNHPTQVPNRTSVMGYVAEVYASPSTLVLASPHEWWRSEESQTDHTYLHKFDITDPRQARYVASGGVEGGLLNQFAMDEHKGYLRLATTSTGSSNSAGSRSTIGRVNQVIVMSERAGRLVETGRTKPLASGERIYAVRFQGDRGYLVTFRQVDPLFTLDLSDPARPRAVGELKVPGFSTYIHPLDNNHLLTMGIHAAENGWSDRSIKLTIFDVTDFANPKEKHTVRVGSLRGSSEAVYEHKAFNFFAEKKLLAIPFSDYEPYGYGVNYWDRFVSDLRVFKVDANTGIHLLGALDMKDIYQKQGNRSWGWGRSRWVRRSVMASDTSGQDFVYAVSDLGIRVANINALDLPLKTAELIP